MVSEFDLITITFRSCLLKKHFDYLSPIRIIHSVMFGVGSCDLAATWQGRRGRVVFEQCLEHRIWPTWYREHPFEDHYWSGGSLHADCAAAFVVGDYRSALGASVRGSGSGTDCDRHARCLTGSEPRASRNRNRSGEFRSREFGPRDERFAGNESVVVG